ncbi:MAG: hypothetical protein IKS92_11675, partial [Victivallales bacterium]|nr:hypothetical protein [Victivallales bacterium]
LRTYGLPVSFSVNENTHHALGGIELADTLGFYRVTMSSHNRNISLSSPFGDVNIDALTGISIKAPNGNIKIEGKNVEITANNRLTLTSGQNIKNGGFFDSISKGDAWKKKGADVLVDNTVAPFLDLSLLRTILEIFIRPIDGTLLIKSHRFMELEAGKGHANVPAAFYKPDETVGHKRRQLADELNVFMFLLSSVGNPLDKYVDEYVVLHNSVVKACNAFITKNNISGTATYRIPGFDNNNVGKLMKAVIAYAGDAKSFLNSQQYTQGYNFKSCKGDLLAPCEDLFKKTKQLKKYAALYGSKKLYTAWNDNMKDASLDKRFVRLFGVSNLENMADLKLETKWNQAGDPTNSMAIPQGGHFYDTIIHILNTTYINAQNAADGDAFFSTSLQASSYVRWKTLVKRIMAKALIDQVATGLFRNFTVVAGQYAPGQQPADPVNPYTNSDWPKYFNGIIFQNRIKVDAGAKEIFAAKAMDTVKKASLFEINVWNETAKGEILFSNSADKTYRFGPNTVSGSANYEVSDTDDNDTLTKALRAAL